MRSLRALGCAALALAASLTASEARAQSPSPSRDRTWGAVSTISMVGAATTQLLMPRVFRSDIASEQTVGTKARWHLSVLAPVMTLTVIALGSELALKPVIRDDRPGCDDSIGGPCASFGMPSTHSLAAFAALGHGAAVFTVDTLKYNQGQLQLGGLVGDVIVPLLFAATTAIGRGAGDFADTGQILTGAGLGLGLGALSGIAYALMQRPDCGYTGNLVCW